ncbi:transmembrane protein, putative [Bodo saltans]|uniref:Transmembrane protein, putative n=1 Tax=Bodo saltans TaxID=75058 RepID=A0A0S4IZD0_BODSA|nr:transmembrane protein, putative [Bodo saltans]|eukprot:CUG18733.1 transmembrane protein, putative [Bodo saltans]
MKPSTRSHCSIHRIETGRHLTGDLEELEKARVRPEVAVKAAVCDSRATMDDDVLTRLSSTVVRLCFDDMGGSPVRMLRYGTTKLRESLSWGPLVFIYVVAAGAGIGKIDNAGAMERTMYQLVVLSN